MCGIPQETTTKKKLVQSYFRRYWCRPMRSRLGCERRDERVVSDNATGSLLYSQSSAAVRHTSMYQRFLQTDIMQLPLLLPCFPLRATRGHEWKVWMYITYLCSLLVVTVLCEFHRTYNSALNTKNSMNKLIKKTRKESTVIYVNILPNIFIKVVCKTTTKLRLNVSYYAAFQ
jgi:hypothetical protein